MQLNFLPAVLEQARADAAGQDTVIAGLARTVLEAADGQTGARFTFLRALAQADAPAPPGPELRRRVAAAVVCRAFDRVGPIVAGAHPGLVLRLQTPAGENAGLPADVLPFAMEAGGQLVFELTESMFSSPHLPHLVGRWLGALPVFAACQASGDAGIGRSVLNLGARQKLPGVAYCSNRQAAWLIPDSDFLATDGHARVRRQMLSPDWAGRSNSVFWRGGARDRERVQAALAASGVPLSEEAGAAAPSRAGDCRLALDLEGVSASSAALFQLLLSGAAVLRVAAADSSRVWLDTRLVAWTHFVPVAADLSDLSERVAWLHAHDAEARAIAGAGRTFAREMDFSAELKAAAATVGAALRKV